MIEEVSRSPWIESLLASLRVVETVTLLTILISLPPPSSSSQSQVSSLGSLRYTSQHRAQTRILRYTPHLNTKLSLSLESIKVNIFATPAMAASSGESGHFDLSSPVYNSIVVDPDEISDGDSEGTLLDDEDEVDFVEPTLEAEIHPSSNEPVTDPNFEQKMFFRLDGMVSGTLKPGKTAELHDKDFLRIAVIWQHRITKEVILQGVRYRRNMYLHGLVERKLNEVTMMLVYSQYDFRDILIQSVITVGLHEVSKIRELIRTN